ncbi:MAG: nitrile hydratase accessory protein [Alphaproteobacteria bacterium]
MHPPEILDLPRLPRDAEGPVFAEPWQAQAFALTVMLHEVGAFTWTEWAQALSSELAGAPSDDGARYYQHWVAALESLVGDHGMARADELHARKQDWLAAYQSTPHGQPVTL